MYASSTDHNIYQYSALHPGQPATEILSAPDYRCESFYIKMALSPDDKYLLAGSSNVSKAFVWDVEKPEEAVALNCGEHVSVDDPLEVTAVAWHQHHANLSATCSTDGCVRIWSLTPEERPPFLSGNREGEVRFKAAEDEVVADTEEHATDEDKLVKPGLRQSDLLSFLRSSPAPSPQPSPVSTPLAIRQQPFQHVIVDLDGDEMVGADKRSQPPSESNEKENEQNTRNKLQLPPPLFATRPTKRRCTLVSH